MRRLLAAVGVGLLSGLLFASPAAAHGQDAPVAIDYRVAVTAVEPASAGVRVRAVEGGARLELRNTSTGTVEILGLQGEPFLKVRPDRVEENRRSPTLYASRTLRGTAKPPADVDAAAPPDWRRTSSNPIVRWHEDRARGGAPARAWSVPLLLDGQVPAVIRGTVERVLAPHAGLWWGGSLLAATLLAVLGLVRGRLHWVFAGLAVMCGGLAVALTVATAFTATTPGSTMELLAQLAARIWPLLTGLGFVAAGVAVALRRPAADIALSIAGSCLTFMAGIANGAVFSHAVVAAPSWSRVAVAVVIAVGLGLTGAGLLRWYRGQPTTRAARVRA
jgi:hypothetical protein